MEVKPSRDTVPVRLAQVCFSPGCLRKRARADHIGCCSILRDVNPLIRQAAFFMEWLASVLTACSKWSRIHLLVEMKRSLKKVNMKGQKNVRRIWNDWLLCLFWREVAVFYWDSDGEQSCTVQMFGDIKRYINLQLVSTGPAVPFLLLFLQWCPPCHYPTHLPLVGRQGDTLPTWSSSPLSPLCPCHGG